MLHELTLTIELKSSYFGKEKKNDDRVKLMWTSGLTDCLTQVTSYNLCLPLFQT